MPRWPIDWVSLALPRQPVCDILISVQNACNGWKHDVAWAWLMWPKHTVMAVIVIVALVAMTALLVFVVADVLGHVVKDTIEKVVLRYRRMGPVRFYAPVAAFMVWTIFFFLLAHRTGWPHTNVRGGYLGVLLDSPSLLREGTFAAYVLFAWIWVPLPASIAFSLWQPSNERKKRLKK